ncbi:MAG TPA: SapB/AmfS family lanthipeptide [Solirubrobacteraceae bacterium]|nr:SapB/AmfS family lanthipeptide [Solirubrobacteraceae bacterium]
MSILDLQGLPAKQEFAGGKNGNGNGNGGGSTLTVATCESVSPSNLSVALCH